VSSSGQRRHTQLISESHPEVQVLTNTNNRFNCGSFCLNQRDGLRRTSEEAFCCRGNRPHPSQQQLHRQGASVLSPAHFLCLLPPPSPPITTPDTKAPCVTVGPQPPAGGTAALIAPYFFIQSAASINVSPASSSRQTRHLEFALVSALTVS
ncbi:hypothetical protein GOODEAATRI_025615, partial [Goodea atripinnis]